MMKSILYNLHKAFKSKRARAILLCLVSMFSLSAQTPRKDSGADGSDTIGQVLVGNKLPQDFWSRKVKIYNQGDTALVELSKYKGKSFLLDFWSTTCGTCISGMSDLIKIQKSFGKELNVLLVNSYGKLDTYQRIHKMPIDVLRTNDLSTVYADDYLIKLFPHRTFPFYVWVDQNGTVVAVTLKRLVEMENVETFIKYNRLYEKSN
ncbi:TlpA family protein disulfide reductase [Sphingobacterium multivorum]|uniref:TlpA family protein disulfide reductase n=1 Tax=Sphingobacterium multivorum TaxID=28454 RepID=UPI000E0EAA15|nr:TlpA disulfide reductase family protein [Sphingobacterium multivorum]QQT43639.1 TlpA family protein disulfide reductase [Sphingobacterium multivorum]